MAPTLLRRALALGCFGLTLLTASTAPAAAQDSFKDVESRVTEFTLKNGMKFIILERHQAPVASFYTYADVGSAQEVKGITGLAHMFEHMAFKGTPTVGTTNYAEEKQSLDQVDRAFRALQVERDKGNKADPAKLEQLQKDFEAAQETAGKFVVKNEFSQAIDNAGGRGLNASTSSDKTDYFFSLPSNSSELWFYLESERFLHPVFREFYKERDVVMEERRMRSDNQPFGKLMEEFLHAAYRAHPYGEPTVGHMSDLQNFSRPDAEAFFKKYYIPSNLTSVIVGDVDPKKMKQLAETYFERIPSSPKPDPTRTTEPAQDAERRVLLRLQAQRAIMMGYHIGNINDPDTAVYAAISSLLSDGRSSRLYSSLVRDKKVAVQAGGFNGYPGLKYPTLFVCYVIPAPGKSNEEAEKSMLGEIEKLRKEPVTADELEGVKTRARMDLLRSFKDNSGMGQQLAAYQVLTGDWHNLFRFIDQLDKVTPADVQRVAKRVFVNSNQTVGVIEPVESASAAAPQQQQQQ